MHGVQGWPVLFIAQYGAAEVSLDFETLLQTPVWFIHASMCVHLCICICVYAYGAAEVSLDFETLLQTPVWYLHRRSDALRR